MRMRGKIAGLCLVATFVVSVALAGTAQAAHWELCSEVGSATKYTTDQCTTASGTGKWQWNEITGTEEVRIKGSLMLADTKVPVVGRVAVECYVEGVGHVGPGEHGRFNEIKLSPGQCRNVENCEKIEKIEARDLPWQMEPLVGAGSGEPGWAVECRVMSIKKTDECLSIAEEPEGLLFENIAKGSELLVSAAPTKSTKAKCSVGGAEAGEIAGTLALATANGEGLRAPVMPAVRLNPAGTLSFNNNQEASFKIELNRLEDIRITGVARESGTNFTPAKSCVGKRLSQFLLPSCTETVRQGAIEPSSGELRVEAGDANFYLKLKNPS